jgi:hypothetical protein
MRLGGTLSSAPRWALALVTSGILLRVAALPLPGTEDVPVFKAWSRQAILGGPASVYRSGPPRVPGGTYVGQLTILSYPPLALYEMLPASLLYSLWSPTFRDTVLLTVMVKLFPLVADAGLAVLIFWSVRHFRLFENRDGKNDDDWRAASRYWVNPGAILTTAALGYTDPLVAAPALGALVATQTGGLALAGALFGAAVMTKPQGLLIGPAIAVAIWHRGDRWRGAASAIAGFGVTALLVMTPMLLAGVGSRVVAALRWLIGQDMLSGQAANVWWIAGYLIEVREAHWTMRLSAALTRPAEIIRISTVMASGWPNPRVVSGAAVIALTVWTMFRVPRNRVNILSVVAIAALAVHGYFVLATNVHENHLFLAIPLLAITATGRIAYRSLFWTVSLIHALNLNLFYGLSLETCRWCGLPRGATLIDATVVLAFVNICALAWHVRVFNSEWGAHDVRAHCGSVHDYPSIRTLTGPDTLRMAASLLSPSGAIAARPYLR